MKKMSVLLFLMCMPSPGLSVEIAGVEIPGTIQTDGITLVLNGAGLRTKTFLKIKVYAAGLYLPEKSDSGGAIVAADTPMAIRMVFIYDGVSPEKLVDAWNEGFENAGATASLENEIGVFNACFTREAKRGDVYDLIYLPGKGVAVIINGAPEGMIPGLAFKKALFSIWLGDDPCDDDLKEAMLGMD
ncbi:MAG: chalcone isomerase family protein [PVC group bacterium]